MKNLLEQLDRMKELMVYQKGSPINEISTNVAGSTQLKQKSNKKDDEEKKEGSENKTILPEENCRKITKTEPFGTDITEGDGAKKFIEFFGEQLNKEYGKLEKGGKLYLKSATVFGGASNYYKNKGTKPDYCNKYDETVGTTSLIDWSSKCEGFGTDGNTRYTYTKGYDYNLGKSEERAKNVLQKVREGIIEGAEKMGIELPNGFDSQDIEYLHGTIYTGDKTDENKATSKLPDGKNGQIVMIDAIVCYVPPNECTGCKKRVDGECKCREEDGLKEDNEGNCICIDTNQPPDENCQCAQERGCPKCQEKDENDDCKCKPGLKDDGNGNCVCIDTDQPPDDDCNCPEIVKECGSCEKLNEDDECECENDDLEQIQDPDNEGKTKCVCKDENKIQQGCRCVNPIPCNFEREISGGRGFKDNSYVSKKMENMPIPGDIGGKVTITLDSLVVPDAFYVRYGTKDETYFDEFSGFMGDVSNENHTQINLSPQEKKLMYKIQIPRVKEKIKKAIAAGDNDYSVMNNGRRNFIGELLVYKNDLGLSQSIKDQISKYKGKTQVTSIFKNGDDKAQTITNNIADGKVSYGEGLSQYGNIMEKEFSFEIEKREGASLTILVFSPLSKTKFTLSVKCES